MKYRIKYTYDTGDSFHNEYGLESYLELEWENLEVAKANLKRIEEHYKQYEELKRYNVDNDKLLQANKSKDWFVSTLKYYAFDIKHPDDMRFGYCIDEKHVAKVDKKEYVVKQIIDPFTAQYNIKLYTDKGKVWQIHAPWCGYFESLNDVEIVAKDEGMKINIK